MQDWDKFYAAIDRLSPEMRKLVGEYAEGFKAAHLPAPKFSMDTDGAPMICFEREDGSRLNVRLEDGLMPEGSKKPNH